MIDDLISEVSNAKIENLVLVGILAFCFFILANSLFRALSKRNRRNFSGNYASYTTRKKAGTNLWSDKKFLSEYDMSDPRNQIEAVSKVKFERIRLLNKSEERLLPFLEDLVQKAGNGHRVMAQTSLGEIIRPVCRDKRDWARANASINSKRLDFAIFNRSGILVAAIEYQGSGHHHQTTFMRDAVKREALRRAGVPMIEVRKGSRPESVRSELLPILRNEGA